MLPRISKLIRESQPVKIVCYGDSISEVGRTPKYCGGATCPEMNWGPQLGAMLRDAYPKSRFDVVNFGIGGQNSYELLGRLDWIPANPDLVLIETGANDCYGHDLPPHASALAVGYLIDGVRGRHNADVIVVGIGGDNPREPMLNHFDHTLELLRFTARQKEAPYADVRSAMLDATRGGETWNDFHNGSRDCHPNDRGMKVWATAVFATLQANLQT